MGPSHAPTRSRTSTPPWRRSSSTRVPCGVSVGTIRVASVRRASSARLGILVIARIEHGRSLGPCRTVGTPSAVRSSCRPTASDSDGKVACRASAGRECVAPGCARSGRCTSIMARRFAGGDGSASSSGSLGRRSDRRRKPLGCAPGSTMPTSEGSRAPGTSSHEGVDRTSSSPLTAPSCGPGSTTTPVSRNTPMAREGRMSKTAPTDYSAHGATLAPCA